MSRFLFQEERGKVVQILEWKRQRSRSLPLKAQAWSAQRPASSSPGKAPHPLRDLSQKALDALVGDLVDHWVSLLHLSHYCIKWYWQDQLEADDTVQQGMYVHALTQADPQNLVAHVHFSRLVLQDEHYEGIPELSSLVAHELFHVALQDTLWVRILDAFDSMDAPDHIKAVLMRGLDRGQENLVTRMETVFERVPVPEKKRRAA